MGEELRWREPEAVRRASQKAYRKNLEWYVRLVMHRDWFSFLATFVPAGLSGYALYGIWSDDSSPFDAAWNRIWLKCLAGLLVPVLFSGFFLLQRFGSSEVRITRKGIAFRHHLDNKRTLWKWNMLQRAEVARTVFPDEEGRVLQLFFENPKLPPALLGIAPEVTDSQLQDILTAHDLPLTFSSFPPQGLKDWQ